MKNNFISALTIEERCKALDKNDIHKEINLESLRQWRYKNNILSDEQFDQMLASFGYSKPLFSQVVDKENSEHFLYESVLTESKWYKTYQKTINLLDDLPEESYEEEISLVYYIRNFTKYFSLELSTRLKEFEHLVESTEQLIEELTGQCANNLIYVAYKTLILELNIARENHLLEAETSEERYAEFCKKALIVGNVNSLFEKYPVLCRLLTVQVEYTLENIVEFFSRYESENSKLCRLFHLSPKEKIHTVSLGEGDSHQQGHSVYTIKMTNQFKFVYKPKNLQLVTDYNRLLKIINEHSEQGSPILDFKVYNGIYCKYYSFEEFIAAVPCENYQQIKNFYRRFGQTLCLMYILSGQDMHMENVVAHGEYPVIVDLETLLQQKNLDVMKGTFSDHYVELMSDLGEGIISSGLLPEKMTELQIDLSALAGGATEHTVETDIVINEGLDTMKIDKSNVQINKSNNLVSMDKKTISYEAYAEDILVGFKNLFEWFMEHKEFVPKDLFSQKRLRVLLRNTSNYARFLENSYHPTYMSDSLAREHMLSNIFNSLYSQAQLSRSEYNDLLVGDIPIFFNDTHSVCLIGSQGITVEGFFEKTGKHKFYTRLSKLSVEDKQFQEALIRSKIMSDKIINTFPEPEGMLLESKKSMKNDMIAESEVIADWIIERAKIREESALFYTFEYDEDSVTPIVIDTSLYSGLTGVCVYFLRLYQLTQKEEYRVFSDRVLNAIEGFPNLFDNYGAFTGLGSQITLYSHYYQVTKQTKYLEKINRIAQSIEKNIDSFTKIDWIDGTSSLAMLFIDLYERMNSSYYLKLAILCLEKTKEIIHLDDNIIGGFSHGYSSLSWLFIKAGKVLNDEGYLSLGQFYMEKDNAFFDQEQHAWVDNRFEGNICQDHWCHGSVGIGISRLHIEQLIGSGVCKQDIVWARNHIMNAHLVNDDTLCHGNFGKTEFFLENGEYTLAEQLTQEIIEKKNRKGFYDFQNINSYSLCNFGLFMGISGIGYQLLRVAEPKKIPSILTLV